MIQIIADFLLATLVYFILNLALTTFVTDAKAQSLFRVVLIIICLVIAFGGTLFFHWTPTTL